MPLYSIYQLAYSAVFSRLTLLEGEELFSLRRGEEVALVTTNTVSMFLYLKGGEVYRHKQSTDGSRYVKKVIFFL